MPRGPSTASSTASVGDSTKPSRADKALLEKADAICERVRRRYRAGVSKGLRKIILNQEEERVEVYEGLVDRVVVPLIEGEVEDLQALRGSSDGEEAVDRLTVKLEEIADQVQADPVAWGEGPVPAAKEAEVLSPKLGFEDCGPP